MKPKIIGLTGGIGSGKTTIANYFNSLGVPVYIADDEAKEILYLPDTIVAITENFGNTVLTDGIPDKKKLSKLVFDAPDKLQELNAIIHPRVRIHFENWLLKYTDNNFIIKEAAILFESGSYKDCDKVILVTAPEDIRIERVINRDKVSREDVLKRIANQWSDDKKKNHSDFIIENIDLNKAIEQAKFVYKTLKNNIK